MQAARLLRKVCLIAALMPLAAYGGELRISLHMPWLLPSVLAALFPYEPLPVSAHHLSAVSSTVRTVRGGVAVDERTFVSAGIHYRLRDEARGRSELQSLLDGGPLRVRVLKLEDSGIRIVSPERDG